MGFHGRTDRIRRITIRTSRKNPSFRARMVFSLQVMHNLSRGRSQAHTIFPTELSTGFQEAIGTENRPEKRFHCCVG